MDVLVPLDGSSLAEQVLPLAASLARHWRRTLQLLSVVPATPAATVTRKPAPAVPRPELDAEARLRRYLDATAEKLSTTHDIPVSWAVMAGSPAEVIAERAAALDAALVLMATHGRGGLSRWWLGSVADGLLRRLTVPMLLYRPDHEPQIPDFSRVLVALDGSKEAEAALGPALSLGSLSPAASFTLVRVLEPPLSVAFPPAAAPAFPPDWPGAEHAVAVRYLERIAERLRERGIEVATSVLMGTGVAHQVTRLAREMNAGLIAVATHGAGGLERMFLGSVADKIIRSADHAVLVAPAGGVPAARPGPRRQRRRSVKAGHQ